MKKHISTPVRNLFLLGALLTSLTACTEGKYSPSPNDVNRAPTYNQNSSQDDNGVEPRSNNGNQNFGRRW